MNIGSTTDLIINKYQIWFNVKVVVKSEDESLTVTLFHES